MIPHGKMTARSLKRPRETLGDLSAEAAARLLAEAGDLALVLDPDGTIRDYTPPREGIPLAATPDWLGRSWLETLEPRSRRAAEELLAAGGEGRTEAVLYHRDQSGHSLPMRYRLVAITPERLIALAHSAREGNGVAGVAARSVEQATALVGKVPLRELIRNSTDRVERRCIETALRRTGNNRASAAALLGLSRQSLYAKLRRHGLMDSHRETD